MNRIALCAVVVCWAALAGDVAGDPAMDAGAIVAKMMAADDQRRPRMPEHSSVRVYQLENKRFGTRASMKARMTYRDGRKQFEILEQSGPGPVRNKVFKRMIESEAEANTGAERDATRISPQNYTFRLLDSDVLDGRKCLVLDAEPKTKNKFLFRGKVWVDVQDWAVAKIEASPAQKPSVWVRKTSFVHRYRKFGDQWLAVSNDSVSEVMVFGKTEIRIEYADYQFPNKGGAADAAMTR
jgi:hypothetical protein